jgi:beta-glucanase (GH16 family)
MLSSTTPLQWPDDGEIDIMEHVGFDPGVVHGSVHCKKYYHVINTQKTDTISVPDCMDEFHVYALEWNEENISIFVDQKKYFVFTNEHNGKESWPFDQPAHLLLNVAVGGDWGGAKGVDEKIWPQRMLVDYVRVYSSTKY